MIIAGTNNVITWRIEYDEATLQIDPARSYVCRADPQPGRTAPAVGVMRSIRGAAVPTAAQPAPPSPSDSATEPTAADGESDRSAQGSVVHGLVGLAKSHLGIDRSSDDLIAHRWQICSTHATGPHRCCNAGLCTACGCHISAKIRIASEACPLGRW